MAAVIAEGPDSQALETYVRALAAAVVANVGVAGVLAGHEHTAGRRAHVVAGVVRGELHALAGEAVDVWRRHLGRAIATEIAVTEVIGENEDDVGFFGGVGATPEGREQDRENEGAHGWPMKRGDGDGLIVRSPRVSV